MAFLKKKAYNQTSKNIKNYNTIGCKKKFTSSILESVFSDVKKVDTITIDDSDSLDSTSLDSNVSNLHSYRMSSSPVCETSTSFDLNTLHDAKCPTETKKPTNINLYTRYNVNCFSKLPTCYLVWYNVVISTGFRNRKAVCCASVRIDVSTILGSSGFVSHLQKNICCETLYTTNVETVENIENNIYLDSITSKTEPSIEGTCLSSIFVDFYNVLLSIFEDMYPNCITFGLNNIILKNIQVNTNKIFSIFLENIKEKYNFYYKPIKEPELTEDIQKIKSWLSSPITEKLNCLDSDDESLDFLNLLE
ncbi:MAG: hypothetical protein WD512_19780 [Candidatus Paceibacterota bacterium]